MSAVHKPSTVAQLADALAPHAAIVHHDFSQQPDFVVDRPNVRFVTEPKRTGYGVWGFSEGVLRLIEFCLQNVEFDYFQLLSPTCLPIKPLEAFTGYLERTRVEASVDFVDLYEDLDAYMQYAYRTWAGRDGLRHKLLGRASGWYFGASARRLERVGLAIRTGFDATPSGAMSLRARAALAFTRLATSGPLDRSPFGPQFHPLYGASWFGASREACRYLLEQANRPEMRGYFQRLTDPDEVMFASILGNSRLKLGPLNTFVNTYEETAVRWLRMEDFERLMQVPQFFARKFPDDAESPLRRAVIARVQARAAETSPQP